MADGVLFNVAEAIISSLPGPQDAKEITLPWDSDHELQNFRSTVSAIKAVLLDAEKKRANPQVDSWLKELNIIMYDANDTLDAISTEVLRRKIMSQDKKVKKVSIFLLKSNEFVFRFKMGHKIKIIRERLENIKDRRNFSLAERSGETPVQGDGTFIRDQGLIGRDKDKEKVIESLLDTNIKENVSILPIVGMGGIGKTTLAEHVFKDKRIQRNFDLKIWVCVCNNFDAKVIVEKILESALKNKPKRVPMDILVDHLRQEVLIKKFFLVLDDMWNEDFDKWFELKNLLMDGVVGSRILITTRSEKVSEIIHPKQPPFTLKGLEDNKSWDLFRNIAFKNGQEPENLSDVEIAKKVVERCGGVPLALGVMGRVLYAKRLERECFEFTDSEFSKISQNDDIIPTLKLSYDMLPSNLKHCFAYCGLFPKGFVFDVSTLISLWIAQGFVESQENRCLEDIGYNYFKDLLSRSFFHEVELDEFDIIIQCKMHNLMHELALSVAAGLVISDHEKENFNRNTLHLANYSSTMPSLLYKANMIRTFLCPGVNKYFSGKINCKAIFSSFKFLRVLDLRNRKLKHLSGFIGKLKYLRYLDLSHNNEIVKLPNSITRLLKLEILRLSDCWSLEELPRDISKLVNLRHLKIDGCWGLRYMPRKLGELTNLQILPLFVINSDSYFKHIGRLDELKRLNKLRGHLRIQYLSHAKGAALEYKDANLNEKGQLCGLDLNWKYEGNITDSDVNEDNKSLEGFNPNSNLKQLYLKDYRGSKVPSWLSLRSLEELKLLWCRKCHSLSPVSELPSLKCLWLWNMHAIEYISDFGSWNMSSSSSSTPAVIFPSLKELWLRDCPKFKSWWKRDSSVEVDSESDSDKSVEKTARTPMMKHSLLPTFHSLSKLSIEECPLLTLMPKFPHLEEELCLYKANWMPLKQTMMEASKAPLSRLKHLKLHSVMELRTLPKEWMQNLISLKTLTIESCNGLKSLSLGIEHLTALEHLDLSSCPKLKITKDDYGINWRGLKSLLSLSFKDLPKLKSLPLGLEQVTTLQNLEIAYCGSLTVIPEWIQDSKSLEVLKIVRCSNLTSLPQGMRRLTVFEDAKDEKRPISPR